MGTKANPAPNDCHANALPDEPIFTLLARDRDAPLVVRTWAEYRIIRIDKGECPATDEPVVREALACAEAMEDWRRLNVGRWRKPPVEALVDAFVRDVCELSDRNSPEGEPDTLLITRDELTDMLREFATQVAAQPAAAS